MFAGALNQLGTKSRSIEATELIVTDLFTTAAPSRVRRKRVNVGPRNFCHCLPREKYPSHGIHRRDSGWKAHYPRSRRF